MRRSPMFASERWGAVAPKKRRKRAGLTKVSSVRRSQCEGTEGGRWKERIQEGERKVKSEGLLLKYCTLRVGRKTLEGKEGTSQDFLCSFLTWFVCGTE